MASRREYMILSGEGTGAGTWERTRPMTETGIKRRLTRERCGGDRWAQAYYRCESDQSETWINVESGFAHHIHGQF